MTMSREQIRELAEFDDAKSSAVSFYFQPSTPRNKAHKEDAILVKDLIRDAMSRAKKDAARADLERILHLIGDLRTNGTHAKAVFACAAGRIWQEYDLPAVFASTRLFVDRRFHLTPMAHLLGAFPRLGVVLMDRHRARIFDLRLGELVEREGFFQPLSRKGRSDGYAGYDGGHAQRRVDDEARQHFKTVAETLKQSIEKGVFEKWILGCQDAHRSLIEAQLHPYVKQALLGRFQADLGRVTGDEIRAHAQRIFEQWRDDRCRELAGQVLNQARSRARGVTGLKQVFSALERGEVQTLLVGENLQAHAVECVACGHLDAHLVETCPDCGRATQQIVDVGEALLPRVIRRDIELFYVKSDPEFDRIGNIAALLRFRASNLQPISSTVADNLAKAGAAYPGRLRRFASR